MAGMPIIKRLCLVLCRTKSIVAYIESEPPIRDMRKSVDSLTLALSDLFDIALSYAVTMIATSDTKAK